MFRRNKIPKQYRIPRPTALPGADPSGVSRALRLDVAVVLLAVVVAGLSPPGPLSDWLNRLLLTTVERPDPVRTAMVVYADPRGLALGDCPHHLAQLVSEASLQAVVLLPPADGLCAPEGIPRVPTEVWPVGVPRTDLMGRAVGFVRAPAIEASPLRRAGVPFPTWFAPGQAAATPALSLDDLVSGQVPLAAIGGRIAVVEVAAQASPRARLAATALARALESPTLSPPSRILVALSAGLIAALIVWTYIRGLWLATLVAAGLFAAVWLSAWVSFAFELAGPWPLIPLLLVPPGALLGLQVPRWLANRRALAHATDLIERAALMRSAALHTIADAEFWARVGDLAMQAHPADSVLVAELPPGKWHLKFWTYRGMGDNVIKERRRDIRRTPYSNEEGTPGICVTRRMLVMEGTPSVVVPLIAMGEVEGYIFLCGDQAERAYHASPEIAQRISRDLGLMLRRRRIGILGEGKWRRRGDHVARGPSLDTVQLVEGAELALGDLKMLNTLVRHAPVGLLYADAFGHVRVLGEAFAEWLPRLDVRVPAGASEGTLLPGTLMVGDILGNLRDDHGESASLAQVIGSETGVRYEVPVPRAETDDPNDPQRMMVFTLGALREQADGLSWVAGYVGTLAEAVMAPTVEQGNTVRLPIGTAVDVLTVQALSTSIRDVARAAAASSGRPVQYESPREMGHAIAYHRSLADALTDLLYDLSLRDTSGNGPVLTVEEGTETVDIHIMDVMFGLPTSALRRALLAPSDPPDGLQSFGRLVLSVSDSHGRVRVKEDDWGVTVTASLLRARPLAVRPSLRPPPMLHKKTDGSA